MYMYVLIEIYTYKGVSEYYFIKGNIYIYVLVLMSDIVCDE